MIPKLADLVEWLIVKRLTPEQKEIIWNKIPPYGQSVLQKLLSPGEQYTLRRVERAKRCLHQLGFTDRPLMELHEMLEDKSQPFQKRTAAWELALWEANQYTPASAWRCLSLLPIVTKGEKDSVRLIRATVLKAECHDILADRAGGFKTVKKQLNMSLHADLYLAAANLEDQLDKRLVWINKALALYELAPVTLEKVSDIPPYDRLAPTKALQPLKTNGNPKVTVIIPAYNSQDTIGTALDSMLAQTWSNLEILVVDDCSSDLTAAIVKEYADKDPRIKLLKTNINSGPYVARNIALKEACGDFVTTNDADDWSHPVKIEKQAQHLLENPFIVANISEQARATSDLKFYRRGNPGFYIHINMSSMMFRRQLLLDSLGAWDCVRFGADGEFVRRARRAFGDDSVIRLSTGPLSFQRQSPNSLTGDPHFGYHGFFMGARKEYFEASNYYHDIATCLRYEFPQKFRPFPVPEPMWPQREARRSSTRYFDVIIASEFRLPGGTTMSNLEEIKVHKKMGLRTGLIQMYRYDLDTEGTINSKIREMLDGKMVQMLVYGEKVSCDLLILRHPLVLQDRQRFLPAVKANDVRVIVNQSPKKDYTGAGLRYYEIKRCSENLKHYFGRSGIWHPIGPQLRKMLYDHHFDELSYVNFSDEDWTNIIDAQKWRRTDRPPQRSKIRIGRHSRDQYVKWPADPGTLLSIYPDAGPYEVYVLGGAQTPKNMLGSLPDNWIVFEFGAMHPKDFLAKLDVFVYYIHPDCIESFGRVILEAMAVGVPVVIPPSYRELFADAAIYAEPLEVSRKIDDLMSNPEHYKTQVKKAYDYVEKTFGYTRHALRVEKISKRQNPDQKRQKSF
ncbi:MAG: glycosyltransferase [Desulfobacterales bacterium]|nr:glycosyltransferase [Desulfobacterales bacterium]